jgi:hypothetical protein
MKPNCTKCKHYFITYDQKTPRGCRIYQIQSASMPSQIVKQANAGSDCIGFEAKPSKTPKKKDFNDARYW